MKQLKKQGKAIRISIVAGILIVDVFFSGCNKKTEEAKNKIDNSASEMQNKLDEQQAKIDELQKFKDEQQQANEEMNKNQELADCQKKKDDCKNKIFNLSNSEIKVNEHITLQGNRADMIKKINNNIDNYKDNIKQYEKSELNSEIKSQRIKEQKQSISELEKQIKTIEGVVANEQQQKAALLSGECRNYNNPCE